MMEKLSLLLDEATIINVKLVNKLIVRYKRQCFFIILAIFFCSVAYYYSRPVVFSVSLPMKTFVKHTVAHDLSSLTPVENNSAMTLGELSVSLRNFSFLKLYAANILASPQFENLHFGLPESGRDTRGSEIKTSCRADRDCMINKLASLLQGTYSIEQSSTDDRFILTLNSLDEKTVDVLKGLIAKSVEEQRIAYRQYIITKEMSSVESLINESRSIVAAADGYAALDIFERNQTKMNEMKERQRTLQAAINSETAALSAISARAHVNAREVNRSVNSDHLQKMERINRGKKVAELRQNIAHLSNVPAEDLSSTDKIILLQLKKELGEMKTEGQEAQSDFDDEQLRNKDKFEFEQLVSQKKLLALQSEFEETKKELEILSSAQIAKESSVNKIKSDLEFLKNLEAKQLSLKLMNSTITSDLMFDEVRIGSTMIRAISFLKALIVFLGGSLFSCLVFIIVRFVADDRIYSSDDLRLYFSDAEFIGEVPSFEA